MFVAPGQREFLAPPIRDRLLIRSAENEILILLLCTINVRGRPAVRKPVEICDGIVPTQIQLQPSLFWQ